MSRMSYRSCNRCRSRKRDGQRCTRRTCKYGPNCWQHTRTKHGVRVARSKIQGAGMGLFATRDLPRGSRIPYLGKTVPEPDYDRMFGDRYRMEYAVTQDGVRQGDPNIVIDAAKTNSTVARYSNDGRGSRYRNNAKLDELDVDGDGDVDGVFLVAKNRIPRGKEILNSYGRDYWSAEVAPDAFVANHRQWILS